MSVRDSIILNKTDLRYLLIDSLKLYSDNVMFIGGNNPYKFVINKGIYYILIKNIHESGHGRDNPDECRIQVSNSKGVIDALRSSNDFITLGYFADEKTFTVGDPKESKHKLDTTQFINKPPAQTKSLFYSRFSKQKKASKNGISLYIDNNKQHIISFKPNYLGLYLENLHKIHLLSELELLELISTSDESNTADFTGEVVLGKEKLIVTHTRFKRDPRFKKHIYHIYDNRCAMCGIQLELIEAAHIVPHSHAAGSDDVTNGISLCVLHHKAYDNALIYFDENYKILINDDKMKYLKKMKRDSGYKEFIGMSDDELILPENHAFRPDADNIKIANSIRGIS